MGQPAAKQGDQVVGTCIHIIMIPAAAGVPVPTPLPHMFMGIISGNLSTNVNVMGMPAATLGSTADNTPPHLPMGPGPFQIPPRNKGLIITGSPTVFVNNKPMARTSDTAMLCADPVDIPVGNVIAVGTVFVA
jgi:uncharacterized Zn-binding protein involved in type VI secretion